MGCRKYRELIDPLVSFTCEKFNELNLEKVGLITLIYEIIREGIADLHNKQSIKHQLDAQNYFDSDLFDYHCQCVAIPTNIMLKIVYNPENYLNRIAPYNQDLDIDNETSLKLSDLS